MSILLRLFALLYRKCPDRFTVRSSVRQILAPANLVRSVPSEQYGINENLILGAHPCLSDLHNTTDVISIPKSARFILRYGIRLAVQVAAWI